MDTLAAAVLTRLEAGLRDRPAAEPIYLAYSGGLDSTVLLHILAHTRKTPSARAFWEGRSLRAIHINHGLQVAANDWARHCRQQCERWSVSCDIEDVAVARDAGKGLEAAAREARYQAFAQRLGNGGVLLTAHHLDDQAETLLQRLMRASGLRGLAGMPESRPLSECSTLFRPLLSTARRELETYAQAHGLSWIEDPSNESEQFDRNFLRHQVMPLFEQRWSAASRRLADSARHLRADLSLLDTLVEERLAQLSDGPDALVLKLSALRALAGATRKGLLRHWLARWQCFPSENSINELDLWIVQGSNDGQARWQWGDLELRLWRDRLYRLPSRTGQGVSPLNRSWKGELSIPWGDGLLCCEWQVVPQGEPRLRADADGLLWRSRRGGERCRLPGRSHHHSLKQLLQESDIPPWDRAQLPLLMEGDTLVAVPSLFIADGYLAAEHEPGWALHWHRY